MLQYIYCFDLYCKTSPTGRSFAFRRSGRSRISVRGDDANGNGPECQDANSDGTECLEGQSQHPACVFQSMGQPSKLVGQRIIFFFSGVKLSTPKAVKPVVDYFKK